MYIQRLYRYSKMYFALEKGLTAWTALALVSAVFVGAARLYRGIGAFAMQALWMAMNS